MRRERRRDRRADAPAPSGHQRPSAAEVERVFHVGTPSPMCCSLPHDHWASSAHPRGGAGNGIACPRRTTAGRPCPTGCCTGRSAFPHTGRSPRCRSAAGPSRQGRSDGRRASRGRTRPWRPGSRSLVRLRGLVVRRRRRRRVGSIGSPALSSRQPSRLSAAKSKDSHRASGRRFARWPMIRHVTSTTGASGTQAVGQLDSSRPGGQLAGAARPCPAGGASSTTSRSPETPIRELLGSHSTWVRAVRVQARLAEVVGGEGRVVVGCARTRRSPPCRSRYS